MKRLMFNIISDHGSIYIPVLSCKIETWNDFHNYKVGNFEEVELSDQHRKIDMEWIIDGREVGEIVPLVDGQDFGIRIIGTISPMEFHQCRVKTLEIKREPLGIPRFRMQFSSQYNQVASYCQPFSLAPNPPNYTFMGIEIKEKFSEYRYVSSDHLSDISLEIGSGKASLSLSSEKGIVLDQNNQVFDVEVRIGDFSIKIDDMFIVNPTLSNISPVSSNPIRMESNHPIYIYWTSDLTSENVDDLGIIEFEWWED